MAFASFGGFSAPFCIIRHGATPKVPFRGPQALPEGARACQPFKP
jgi:hypothetical protein